jgi:predicted negative regulator of RcsB-dependent stress response
MIFFLVLTFLYPWVPASSQSLSPGWQLIMNSQFKQAEQQFLEALKQDTTQADAVLGMVFLTEVREDFFHHNKYVSSYINNHWDPDFFKLFQASYNGATADILKSPLPPAAKVEALLDSAFGELRWANDLRKMMETYRGVIQPFKWSYLGPFESPNGSGFAQQYAPESETFKPEKTYLTAFGASRDWVFPTYQAPTGQAMVSQHLTMKTSEPNVFFANTFIQLSEKQTVQFRIARSAPIKVYLNDHLIYERADISPFMYDKEIIEVVLDPGVHRLMIKLASWFPISKSNFNMNFRDYPKLEQDEFTLRLTDPEGRVLRNITSLDRVSDYQKTNYAQSVKVVQARLTDLFEKKLAADPHPFHYYALNKAFLQEGAFSEGEERFVKLLRQHPNSLFFKFLAAKLYSANDKSEMVYATFSGTNYEESPVFQMLWEKHSEIDLDNQEARFLTSVDNLLSVTPSNMRAIRAKIRYFNKVGKEKEKDQFIDEVVKAFPKYEKNLESDRSTFKKKKDRKVEDPKEELAAQKAALKTIKKQYDYSAYQKAIAFHKNKKKDKRVITLYNQLIAGRPHLTNYRLEKVRYLYDQGHYNEALAELDTCVGIKPIFPQAFDLRGDILYQLDRKPEALEAYKKTKAFQYSGGTSYWASDLDGKIEKIEGRVSLKHIFETPEFEDILAADTWYDMTDGEEALVLQYTKDMVLKNEREVEIYQKFMVLILNEAGGRKWTSYDYEFLGNLQSYKLIKNDGTEVIPEYTRGRLVFKNIEPGDLIQLEGTAKYSIHDNFAQAFLDRHFIFFEDPVYYTKLEVALPADRTLNTKVHKITDTMEKTQRGDFNHYNWTHFGLPAVRYEEAVVDQIDPYPNISMSSLPDWSQTVSWYLGETYRKLEMTYDIREMMDSLLTPDMPPREQIRALYNFVSGEIKYSFVPFFNSAYIPKNPTNTLSGRIGDCKDVATLLLTMLRELDIESYYVLVKTNQMDHLDNVPSTNFDHVIVMYILDGDTSYIDLTTDYFPMEVLPDMDCGANALIIKEGVTSDMWLPKKHLMPETNQILSKMKVQLGDDRSVQAKMEVRYQGVVAGKMRERLTKLPVQQHDDFLADRISDKVFSDLEIQDFAFKRLKNIERDLEATISFRANNFLDRVSNLFIFQMPYAFDIPTTSVTSNRVRTNRIHLGQILETTPSRQEIDILFPRGYQLTELPENIRIQHAFGDYHVTFSRIPGGMRVIKEQVFHRDIFEVSEFDAFKDFYRALMDADRLKVAIMRPSNR